MQTVVNRNKIFVSIEKKYKLRNQYALYSRIYFIIPVLDAGLLVTF